MKKKYFCSSLTTAIGLLLTVSLGAQETSGGGTIKVTTTLHADGTRTVTQTNAEEHSSEATTYSHADKVIQKVTYVLDESGQPSESTTLSPTGVVLIKSKLKRDNLGRVEEESDYSNTDVLLRRIVFGYDASGHVNKMDAFDGQGNPLSNNAAQKDKKKSLPFRH